MLGAIERGSGKCISLQACYVPRSGMSHRTTGALRSLFNEASLSAAELRVCFIHCGFRSLQRVRVGYALFLEYVAVFLHFEGVRGQCLVAGFHWSAAKSLTRNVS